MPGAFEPPPQPLAVDINPFVGAYLREGVAITVTQRNGVPHLRYELTGGMKDFSPPIEVDLIPVTETVFAAPGSGVVNADWMPVVFSTLPDGTGCAYLGMRAAPKID